MVTRKRPAVGESVTVYAAWADKEMTGTVVGLHDTQFAFETLESALEDTVYFCEYNGQWVRHNGE